jgi:hypothetical protein
MTGVVIAASRPLKHTKASVSIQDMVEQAHWGWLRTYFDVTVVMKTVPNNTFGIETSSEPAGWQAMVRCPTGQSLFG